jgi:hypothetical protein
MNEIIRKGKLPEKPIPIPFLPSTITTDNEGT